MGIFSVRSVRRKKIMISNFLFNTEFHTKNGLYLGVSLSASSISLQSGCEEKTNNN